MPSTRNRKAKERRSRQLEMLSDVENVDIMFGSYSREGEDNNASENEANLDSGSSRPQQSSNALGEDFRSLLNTNSRENSDIAIETTRLINEEISNQMSKKLNEIKNSLNIKFKMQLVVQSLSKYFLLFKIRCKHKRGRNATQWTEGPLSHRKELGQQAHLLGTKGPVSYNGTLK